MLHHNANPAYVKQAVQTAVNLLRIGRAGEALRLILPFAERHQKDGDVQYLAGIAFLKTGQACKAVEYLSRAAQHKPGNVDYQFHLGEAARMSGKYEPAIKAYKKARKLGRSGYDIEIRIADAYERKGELNKALTHFQQALQNRAGDTALSIRIANLMVQTGEREQAVTVLQDALRQDQVAPLYNNLGVVLNDAGNRKAALQALEKACELAPKSVEYLCNLAKVQQDGQAYDVAAVNLQRALEIDPGAIRALVELATLEERRKNLETAHKVALRALDLEPENAEARLVLARIARRHGKHEDVVRLLGAVAGQGGLPVAQASSIAFELGHAHDRLGDQPAAVRAFSRANQLHAESPVAQQINDAAFFAKIDRQYEFLRQLENAPSPDQPSDGFADPVFLVGFPRSGTTLLEQSLAGHSRLMTSDEQPVLAKVLQEAGEIDSLAALDDKSIAGLRQAYFKAMETAVGPLGDRRLVDKLPLNIVYLCWISRLFPNARIIVALRDPRDVVLSCWMQNFQLNEAMIQFLDIEDTARAYHAVMSFWAEARDRLDISFIEHRYEMLLTDFDACLSRILGFLSLDWEDNVRQFGQSSSGKVISTPSARDVAGGRIFTHARGRWLKYADVLAPVMPVLEPHISRMDYPQA